MTNRLLTLVAIAALATACSEERVPPSFVGPANPGDPGTTAVEVTPISPLVGAPVIFNSAGLGAGSRSWQFGDGTSDTGVVVQHAFAERRTYQVELLFDDGASAPDLHVIRLRVYGADEEPQDPEVQTMRARRRGGW